MRRFSALLVLLFAAAPLSAQLASSKHDLTFGTVATTVKQYDGQKCVFCHTPHNATTTSMALWNRTYPNGKTFTMYYASGHGQDATPNAASDACLSCHEGTIALDAITHEPVTPTGTGGGTMPVGVGVFGTSLTNDHPISLTYPSGTEWEVTPLNGVKLFSGKVECASCHNPHGKTGVTKFLITANTNSALCTSCHKK